ncbi:MAG TPA: heavy metal-responsive transcriptional regulator [Vicinamibacterales bacterium]|jgi:Cu(I)-responsive transcriptional regulator
MWTSQAARQAGVNAQTLRYYERRGLLPKTARRGSGYREYSSDAIRVVRFIKRAQGLGFSLEEIADLVRLREARARDRSRIRAVARAKIAEIDRKIAHLASMREALNMLVGSCEAGRSANCPIIEALDGD